MADPLDPFDRDVVDRDERWSAPLVPVLVMAAVMWGSEVVDIALDGRLDRFGIRPRRLDGLDGIIFAPFLHGGFGHLIANTMPFLILGGAIALGNLARFVQVTAIVALVGGFGTWLTGPDHSLHVGASGLVFGYLTYLVSRGLFARKVTYLLGGLLVLMVYGGILWGLLPRPGISWQGHLFGALAGVLAAYLLHADRPEMHRTGDG
ncbi:MAG TPA: rhomboid family intramembrane serine protease [Acidimicrobiales bacterium]